MKLRGEVLKAFNDIKDNQKRYAPADDYKEADIFEADVDRYTDLQRRKFVGKGEKVVESIVKKPKKEEE
jgi:hypothetical protein